MVSGVQDIPAELWAYSARNSAFLGHRMLQQWVDLAVWEQVLDHNTQMMSILELGSYNGAFSNYLFLQCLSRRMQFNTIDVNGELLVVGEIMWAMVKLGAKYLQADIFDGKTVPGLIKTMPHPMILFCDNGNKPREFQTFAPMLQSGDIIAVHDWTEEFGPEHAKPVEHLLTPLFHEECEKARAITRFWTVK